MVALYFIAVKADLQMLIKKEACSRHGGARGVPTEANISLTGMMSACRAGVSDVVSGGCAVSVATDVGEDTDAEVAEASGAMSKSPGPGMVKICTLSTLML